MFPVFTGGVPRRITLRDWNYRLTAPARGADKTYTQQLRHRGCPFCCARLRRVLGSALGQAFCFLLAARGAGVDVTTSIRCLTSCARGVLLCARAVIIHSYRGYIHSTPDPPPASDAPTLSAPAPHSPREGPLTLCSPPLQGEERKKRGTDIFEDNQKALRRLRTACERAKRQLSSSLSATVELSVGSEEVLVELSRARFDKLLESTFQRCLESVKKCMADAKLAKDKVDEIVLVGGSTRVPRVQQILSEFFNGKALCKSVHPDEAVAYGAAVQGAILAGVRDPSTQSLLLVDVIPLSLGVECEGRQFAKVVPRNTSVPCKKSSEFTTVEDYQTEIDVRIFEGERTHTDGNHLLGEFNITGVERAKRGEAKILVTFEVNTSGMLAVSARDKVTGSEANVEIQHDRGRLSGEEIDRMCQEAERMRLQDEARAQAFAERMAAERGEY